MQNRFFATDGKKSVEIGDSFDFVNIFGTYGGADPESAILYSRVAAAFRAYNLKANTVGNMPFALVDKSGNDFDTSATWENKIGFLPNPSELFRLDTLSYMSSNTIYNLRTRDALGYKVKGLYHAVSTEFVPILDGLATDIVDIERRVGALTEHYKYPEDKRLIRMWRFDHTTDLLPSPHTEAKAIMNAAGIVYYADSWIKHFFERGGVPPTVIGMKGAIDPVKRDDEETKWFQFLRGLGKRFSKMVRVFNAETLDVKQLGSSVTELKDNETYSQALANIAMGVGMPLSLLMANSANYATAKEEKATWYENDIIPFCNWLAYEYNRQVFEPLGYFLEFRPETLDPQQEDETQRAQAMNQYMDVITKCPTYDVFVGMASTLGLELSDELLKALEKFYADKAQKEKEIQAQMQSAGVVVGPDGKPIPQKPDEEKPGEKKPQPGETPDEEEEDEEKKPAKWIPSLDEFKELDWYKTLCFRRLKRGEALTFEYVPRHGGLPQSALSQIKAKLAEAKTVDDIRAAFVVDAPAQSNSDIVLLAQAMNNLAEKGITLKESA